ncbi:MAG: peptide ABC transporter ATP-binding protein, partial [Amoebophilaceae bacterium]|nr:peptide ABC transporter ATP-binding protein [Amoebophilaceae bacterium]
DLGLVAEMCDQVAVMYCGRIIEKSSIQEIFNHPLHPYTRALLDAIPVLDKHHGGHNGRLQAIDGMVPPLHKLPIGCNFQDRCTNVAASCKIKKPLLEEKLPGHFVECFYPLTREGTSKY